MKGKINIICGPTASGKSRLAIDVAHRINGVILNADSMQIYKRVPILTVQPNISNEIIEHRLYNFVDLNQDFSVSTWLDLIKSNIKSIFESGKTPILVGGTGFYLKSLIEGFVDVPLISQQTKDKIADLDANTSNSELHNILKKLDLVSSLKIEENDKRRVLRALAVKIETGMSLADWQKNHHQKFFSATDFYTIYVSLERKLLYQNCDSRFIEMLKYGILKEVSDIKDMHIIPKPIGLKEIVAYLDDVIKYEDMIRLTQQMTRNYAKRQVTWFKHQLKYDAIINDLV